MYCRNAATVRRLNVLNRILEQNDRKSVFCKNFVRAISDGILTIDNISRDLKEPQHPEYVPRNYCKWLKQIVVIAFAYYLRMTTHVWMDDNEMWTL